MKTITKYSVYQEKCEFNYRHDFGCASNISVDDLIDAYGRETFLDPQLVASFDTYEEAKKEFEWQSPDTYKVQGWTSPLLMAEFVFIEKEEYEIDADGEEDFIQGEYLDIKCSPYSEEIEEEEENE